MGLFFLQCETETPDPEGTVHIPDDAFLEALIEEGVDLNGDGYIVETEAELFDSLYLGFYEIADLTGIGAFVNLDMLDVSRNTNITVLWCFNNDILGLDLSQNSALYSLDCRSNLLEALDVSGNPALEKLRCGHNFIPGSVCAFGPGRALLFGQPFEDAGLNGQ